MVYFSNQNVFEDIPHTSHCVCFIEGCLGVGTLGFILFSIINSWILEAFNLRSTGPICDFINFHRKYHIDMALVWGFKGCYQAHLLPKGEKSDCVPSPLSAGLRKDHQVIKADKILSGRGRFSQWNRWTPTRFRETLSNKKPAPKSVNFQHPLDLFLF